MKDERMLILKMVESGKVSVDDAVKLLNAINNAGKTGDMMDSVKKKVSSFAKTAEPKVRAVAEKGMEIGSGIKKKVEDKINESKVKEKVTDAADEVVEEVKEFFDDEDVVEENDED